MNGDGSVQNGLFGISTVSPGTDVEFYTFVTQLGNGNYLVSWADSNGSAGAALDLDIRGQLFSQAGARLGSEFTINSTGTGVQLTSGAVPLSNGNSLVVWVEGSIIFDLAGNPTGIDTDRLMGRLLDSTGTLIGSDIVLNTLPAGSDYGLDDIEVLALQNGGFVVGWIENDFEASPPSGHTITLAGQRFDAAGNVDGDEVVAATYTGLSYGNEIAEALQLVELENGNVAAFWRTFENFQTQEIVAVYDSDGNDIVPITRIDTLPGYSYSEIVSVEHVGNSQVMVAFAGVNGGDVEYSSQVLDLGLSGMNIIDGSPFDDIPLNGTASDDYISGLDGRDIILSGFGDDIINGGAGNDILIGQAGIDTTYGGLGDDIHVTSESTDIVFETAGQGYDSVYTSATFVLEAGLSIERFVTTSQAGTTLINLVGNENGQVMGGNAANNSLYGGAGVDSLYGYNGSDFLEGAEGNDALFGGAGVDRFIFREAMGVASGIDRIYDMNSADNIVVDAIAYSGPIRSLTANEFRVGTAALDADDRIIYDDTTGVFWFDPDGSGAQSQILFGVLNNVPAGVDHTWFELW